MTAFYVVLIACQVAALLYAGVAVWSIAYSDGGMLRELWRATEKVVATAWALIRRPFQHARGGEIPARPGRDLGFSPSRIAQLERELEIRDPAGELVNPPPKPRPTPAVSTPVGRVTAPGVTHYGRGPLPRGELDDWLKGARYPEGIDTTREDDR